MKKTALFLALLFCVSFVFSYNNHPKIKTSPTSKIVLKKNKSNKTTSGSDFITTWQTTTANESITIPTYPAETYSYTVIWGDGLTSTAQTGNATHTYATAGTYTVKITGTFPRIYFNNTGDKAKIMTIEQWGTNTWTSMRYSFYGCTHLTSNATDAPDLSNVTDMSRMFAVTSAFNGAIGSWNTAAVTDMFAMFYNASAFNQDISGWNTAAVTNMSEMFNQATSFNQNIGTWNTASVTNMSQMFMNASAFNSAIGSWNTASVTNMSQMFYWATSFNQAIGGWNTALVSNMFVMFASASAFNQDLGGWDISSVTNMSSMFANATLSTSNYDNTLIGWRTLNTSVGETAIPTGIVFSGGNSQYCAGEAARTALTTTYSWTIVDGGKDATCTLAVSDFNLIKSLKLYPNPATEMIYINGDISKIQKLTIYTVQGKQVKSLHKNFKEINVKSLNSGLYFVELMTKEGTRTVKLIKE